MVRTKKSADEKANTLTVGFLLTFLGGFLDAYTFYNRGRVFANGQAGNVLFFAYEIVEKKFIESLHHFLPLLAFVLGISLAHIIKFIYSKINETGNPRRIIVFSEIILLFVTGFFSHHFDIEASIVVSIACSFQVAAFREVAGVPYSSTMCLGNLRNMGDKLFDCFHKHNIAALKKFLPYIFIIVAYIIGASVCVMLLQMFDIRTIWFSVMALLLCVMIL